MQVLFAELQDPTFSIFTTMHTFCAIDTQRIALQLNPIWKIR